MRTLFLATLLATLFLYGCGDKEVADPCAGVDCGERAQCVEGSCVCDPGYGGKDCATAQVPESIRLRDLRILAWPETRQDGTAWDEGSEPDIYLIIGNYATRENIYFSRVAENAQSVISFNDIVTISEVEDQHILLLVDYDGEIAEPETMATVLVNFASLATTNDFPETAEIDLRTSNGMQLDFSLTYNH
jgi:hypothetical protein